MISVCAFKARSVLRLASFLGVLLTSCLKCFDHYFIEIEPPVKVFFTCMSGLYWLLRLLHGVKQVPKGVHTLVFCKSACYTPSWQRSSHAASQAQDTALSSKAGWFVRRTVVRL